MSVAEDTPGIVGSKIAQSIAGGLAGFGLSLIGYVAHAQQTPGTLLAMKALQTLYPCLAFFIAATMILAVDGGGSSVDLPTNPHVESTNL